VHFVLAPSYGWKSSRRRRSLYTGEIVCRDGLFSRVGPENSGGLWRRVFAANQSNSPALGGGSKIRRRRDDLYSTHAAHTRAPRPYGSRTGGTRKRDINTDERVRESPSDPFPTRNGTLLMSLYIYYYWYTGDAICVYMRPSFVAHTNCTSSCFVASGACPGFFCFCLLDSE